MHRSHTMTRILCAAILAASQVNLTFGQAAPDIAATQAATAPASVATTEPTTMPATQPSSAATLHAGQDLNMNFKDAPIDAVLEQLSAAAGYAIIKEGSVEGRVTLISVGRPLTPAEILTVLNTALKNAGPGYTAIPMEGRILKIVKRSDAKKSNLPVMFGSDPEKIANTDEMITQVLPVGSVDAVRLRSDLTPLFSSDADVTANAGANAIIITDTSANIRRIAQIIASMDSHRNLNADIKVFTLKYASASAAAKLLTDIFQPQQQQQQGGGGFGGGRGGFGGFGGGGFGGGGFGGRGDGGGQGGAGNNGGQTGAGDAINGKVLASADDRTNTLVVTGPTETLKLVAGVIETLDKDPTEGQITFVYALRNGQAENLQGVLNTLFGTGNTTTNGTRATTNNSSTPFGSTAFGGGSTGGTRGGTTGGGRGGTGGGGLGGGLSGGGFGGGNNGNNRGGTSGLPTLSASASGAIGSLTGQVFVVADADTNSLLITTKATLKPQVESILKELDRAVPQVLIKVLIAEVDHTNSSDIGLEYSVLNIRPSGQGSQGGSNFNIGQAITAAANGAGPGGMVFSMAESNATAALKALATTNKIDVLSRPYILASDNQLASIQSGQEVPYISASNVSSTGSVINTVAYQQIGVILNVTPHINPDGLVILDVNPQISTLDTSTITVQQGVTAPIFNLRQAQSRVAIRNGQTIIIGGLMADQKTDKIDKIPLLGDIPGLGMLFQHRVLSKQKTELLIFLTPHVALQPEILKGMTEDEKKGMKLTPNAVDPGVYDEQMKGMNLGATTLPDRGNTVLIGPGGLGKPTAKPAATQPDLTPMPDK